MDLAHFRVDVDGGVAIVAMDRSGEPMNTLGPDLMADFATILDRLEADESITAVVWTSAKADFLAGADIRWFETLDRESAAAAIREGHRQFGRLEALHRERGKPVVAAIRGACLGGGLEVALLASYRIAAAGERGRLGQPEVQLGLIPAGGGTQRLPELIGLPAALDLILTGRSLTPRRALRLGLVDEVVPDEQLLEVAIRRAAEGTRRAGKRTPLRRLTDAALEGNPLGRRLVFSRAEQQMLAETRGNYPAPPLALEAVRIGVERGRDLGLTAEAEFFGELVDSAESRALRSIFFATQELKKERWVADDVAAEPVRKVGVVGGGLMGGGIAAVTATRAGAEVRVKEVDDAGVLRVLRHVRRYLDGRVRRHRMTAFAAERTGNRVTAATEWTGFDDVDVVIEAVFEDLTLKRSILADAEAATGDRTVFASNTSSLPIAEIAAASSRPEAVVGMHYFSPVERMPLLEVVATEKTSDRAVATAVDLGKAQGKTVIVVNDGTGFYTTRILAPYGNEAAFLLEDGASVEDIDSAMVSWGFPVGPILLMDEVGIDVGAKIAAIMVDAYGARMRGPEMMSRLIGDDRKGRKNGRGFYRYRDGERGGVDDSVYASLGLGPRRAVDHGEIQERLALALVNEAARCLEDGTLRSARDGDIAAVMGLGFPPFRGGPFWWVDEVGAKNVVGRLDALCERHGDRFTAADILRDHADGGLTFRH